MNKPYSDLIRKPPFLLYVQVLALSIFILLTIFVLVLSEQYHRNIELINVENSHEIESKRDIIENELFHIHKQIQSINHTNDLAVLLKNRSESSYARAIGELKQIMLINQDYEWINVGDTKGTSILKIYRTDDDQLITIYKKSALNTQWMSLMNGKQNEIIYYSRINKRMVFGGTYEYFITIYANILDEQKRLLGFLEVELNINHLIKKILFRDYHQYGTIYLLSDEGKVIFENSSTLSRNFESLGALHTFYKKGIWKIMTQTTNGIIDYNNQTYIYNTITSPKKFFLGESGDQEALYRFWKLMVVVNSYEKVKTLFTLSNHLLEFYIPLIFFMVFFSIYITNLIHDRNQTNKSLVFTLKNLRKAQEIARIGSWIWYPAKDRVELSDNMYALINKNPVNAEHTFGEIFSVIHSDDAEAVMQKIRESLAKKEIFEMQFRLLMKDQQYHYVQMLCEPTHDQEHGSILRGTIIDINDLKRIEILMGEAKVKAEHATLMKSQFLATMSHEIRTPLNSILGFTGIIQESIKDEKILHYLKLVKSSAKTLLRLINDILDLSKIEAGKFEIEYQPTSLKTLFSEMYYIFLENTKQKNIGLHLIISDEVPDMLYLDETRLRQILFNLIGNAVKFTDKGEIRVEVSHNPDKVDSNLIDLVVSIHDTGVGIPENQIDTIFLNFEQVKGQDKTKYGGTGLGLSITRRLVELMGGKVVVSSKLSKGSVFTLFLYGVKKYDQTKTLAKSGNFSFSGASVLLVTGTSSYGKLIDLLNKSFSRVTVLSDFAKASRELLQIKPEILMIDMTSFSAISDMQYLKLSQQAEQDNISVITLVESRFGDEGMLRNKVELSDDLESLLSGISSVLSVEGRGNNQRSSFALPESGWVLPHDVNNHEYWLALKNEMIPLWKELGEIIVVAQIKEFSDAIIVLAKRYKDLWLLQWAEEIQKALSYYDLNQISQTLKIFPQYVDKIEEQLNLAKGRNKEDKHEYGKN